MQIKSKGTLARYDAVAQALHWLMAAILIYLIFFSHFEELPDLAKEKKVRLHSGLGFLIVALGAFRFYWRRNRPRPAEVATGPAWQKNLASIIHYAFYGFFAIAPATGFVLSGFVSYPVNVFGIIEVSGWLQDSETAARLTNSVHGFSADLMTVLLVLHVGAALYHQFVLRDGLINRMLPSAR